MNNHNYQMTKSAQTGSNAAKGTSNYASTRKPNSAARAEIHSKERKREGRKERTNECVTRKNLWKIIEFSIAQKRESGRGGQRASERGARAIFLC